MGVRSRAALVLTGLIAIALATAEVLAPSIADRELDRALRGAHPAHGRAHHDTLGFAIDDLVLRDAGGAVALSAKKIRIGPALSWPPLELLLDGVTVTSSGIAAFHRSVEWESARTFTKRQFGNFRSLRIPLRLTDARMLDNVIPDARGEIAFADPQHASLRAGTLSITLEATQDVATFELSAGDRRQSFRVDAPGWELFAP